MFKYLNVFRIVYLILLTFVLVHYCLGLFGLSFTPGPWNFWFLCLCLILLINPWVLYYKKRGFEWYHIIFQLLSTYVAFQIFIITFFLCSVDDHPIIPINLDYKVENNEILIDKGFFIHRYYEYHDLVAPLIMKTEIKYTINREF